MRRDISKEYRHFAAMSAAHILVNHAIFQSNRHFACYLARDDEFDTAPIIDEIWRYEKSCYLPALSLKKHKFLEFPLYQQDSSMRLNRYEILEPESEEKRMAKDLDIIFMPLVGFDLYGNRLGMGGGYYDRTFEFLLASKQQKPLLIGLAFEEQHTNKLPADAWDVPLQGILTEKRLLLF